MAILDILGDGSCLAHYELATNVADTGGAYNGTSVGVTFINDPERGPVGSFDGAAYVRGPSAGGGIPIDNNLVKTVTCWFYANSVRPNYNVWSSGKSANGQAYSLLSVGVNGLLRSNYTAQYDYTYKAATTVIYNRWNFSALSGDRLYLGDKLVGIISNPIGATSNTYGFYIGGNGAYDYGYMNATYGQPIAGMVCDLRIFTRVLTRSEIVKVRGATPLPLSSSFDLGVLS